MARNRATSPKIDQTPSASSLALAENPKTPIVQMEQSRCPTCGSTERGDYYNCVASEHSGIDPSGRPYTHVIRRRTKCICGQARIDRSYENRI